MGKSKYGVIARLVWDGDDEVRVPEEMGTPRADQLQGTSAERLTELSGRVCYDSCGVGRSSPDYHKHIQEVGHLSVCEHHHTTVQMFLPCPAKVLLNRPDIWVRELSADSWTITVNPRNILDWNAWSKSMGVDDLVGQRGIGDLVSHHLEKTMPMVVRPRPRILDMIGFYNATARIVPPEHEEEKWISLFVAGSRGFSHELVRHGNFTGISQRSTRFVDEDGSPWVDHPLVQEFLSSEDRLSEDPDNRIRGALTCLIDDTKTKARSAYAHVAENLQKWLISRGVDKFTARKQARGAARGYLGNALYTEIVFSASVGQWKRMLRMRACDGADAEIRGLRRGAPGAQGQPLRRRLLRVLAQAGEGRDRPGRRRGRAMSGKLVVFEGVDGTGKSTQIELAEQWMVRHRIAVDKHREPGGTVAGERIRSLLLDPDVEIHPHTEMMLFFASRTQLAERKVRPALREGRTVILDRYYFSTAAYQGPAIPGGMDRVFVLADDLLLPKPDLVVCLDGDPVVLAARKSGKSDRIEAKGLEYQRAVRDAYRTMAARWPVLFRMIDAARTVEEVHEDVAHLLEALFGLESARKLA